MRAPSDTPAFIPFETFLKVRSATGGTFSPDGRTLAFLMNTSGVPQVYRLDEPLAEPKQLTQGTEMVRSVFWSPDGKWLLFAMDHGGSEKEQLYLLAPDGSQQRELTHTPDAIHTFGGWAPDSRSISYACNRRNPRFFDIYTLDVESGEERCVLERDGYFNAVDWSKDGRQLLVREAVANVDDDLYLLDLETGGLRHLTRHQGPARYRGARFLPDGEHILLLTDHERDFVSLAVLSLQNGGVTRLIEEQADVEGCTTSEDCTRVAVLLNHRGWSELRTARLDGTKLRVTGREELPGVAGGCRLARDGSRAALTLNGPGLNFNVWSVDPDTGNRARWTDAPTGELDLEILVQPEEVRYPTHDGLQIPAWLYRPRGVSGPLPVIVHVHGGPESQDRPNFNAVYQYLVHRGYAVFAPNVRGSTGYGMAYSHLDDREKRYDALHDVEYAHRWLSGTGIADPKRIGVMGGSYGGFTVLWCLTRQPELWAAGVDIVGIANFETFFKHTGPWRRHLRASEYGDPEKDRELLRDLSPIHFVDRIRAPLMVVQGANDPRVPQEESDQMVEQLRARSHPVEYLLFPDEGHGIQKLPNRLTAYPAIARFLDHYL